VSINDERERERGHISLVFHTFLCPFDHEMDEVGGVVDEMGEVGGVDLRKRIQWQTKNLFTFIGGFQ
jgi:hypothetical protein